MRRRKTGCGYQQRRRTGTCKIAGHRNIKAAEETKAAFRAANSKGKDQAKERQIRLKRKRTTLRTETEQTVALPASPSSPKLSADGRYAPIAVVRCYGILEVEISCAYW